MKSDGFTLPELVVTVAIAAILMSIGMPSMQELVKNNRLSARANDMVTALSVARSEAIRRNQQVLLCKSVDQLNCSTSATWSSGWVMFVDANRNGLFDATTDTVLRVGDPLTDGLVLSSTVSLNSGVLYLPSGLVRTKGSFALCDDRGTSRMRAIHLNATGRVRVEKGGLPCS